MRPEIWRFSVFESEVADSYFGCSFSVSPLSVFILVNQIVLISSKWTLTSPLKDTTYFYSSCENIKDLWLCRCSLLLFSTSQNLSLFNNKSFNIYYYRYPNIKIITVSQTSCATLADRRAHMVLLYLVLISLSYRGLERNCLLEYSSKTSIDGSCASSKKDFAGSSRFPGRFLTRQHTGS